LRGRFRRRFAVALHAVHSSTLTRSTRSNPPLEGLKIAPLRLSGGRKHIFFS
jgi:hypothetical protein